MQSRSLVPPSFRLDKSLEIGVTKAYLHLFGALCFGRAEVVKNVLQGQNIRSRILFVRFSRMVSRKIYRIRPIRQNSVKLSSMKS